MRETNFAIVEHEAKLDCGGGNELRIERLIIKDLGRPEIRISWWKDGKMMPRPVNATEKELLDLLSNGKKAGVFSEKFLHDLQILLRS